MPTNGYPKITLDIASPNEPEAHILIIYTGGTFGMGASADGSLVPFDFHKVLEKIPVIQEFNLHISVIAFEDPIDSSNIHPEDWNKITEIIIQEEKAHDGFVILHGTDTMAYTASALSYSLKGLNKPVILTGAQLPISEPRTDGRENLITSLEIASSKNEEGHSTISEVCIFFNHHLIRGNRAQKVQSSKFDAFRSENYPALAEAGIEISYNFPYILSSDEFVRTLSIPNWFTGVAILKIFPGITQHAVNAVLENDHIKGVVLETFGAGNAMTSPWFIESIRKAVKNEVLVINVSQCVGGEVNQGMYATSTMLESAGVISGSDITIEAAITKLMFVLGQNISYKNAINHMLTPICGELSQTIRNETI